VYPAEHVGALPYADNVIELGDLAVHHMSGYNLAGVYVRRISGKTKGISVAEIIISVVGDRYAQEELDAENAEAQISAGRQRVSEQICREGHVRSRWPSIDERRVRSRLGRERRERENQCSLRVLCYRARTRTVNIDYQ
jgi:hypothetical protein